MTPLDPMQTARPQDEDPMAPPFVNENPGLDAINRGLEVAEDEVREIVADAYEEAARRSEDSEEALDDIDYEEAQQQRNPAEREPGSI